MIELGISERRACRALGQHRSTQRKIPTTPGDEAALTADIIELARQYGRYGYRQIRRYCVARLDGEQKSVERIWRVRGSKWSPNSVSAGVCGSMTADGSVCGRIVPITSGPMISSLTALTTAKRSGCCAPSTNSDARAGPSVWRESSRSPTPSRRSGSCASCGAFLHPYVQTTARRSLPLLFGNGSQPSEPRRPTSNLEALGKTAIAKLQRQTA